MLALCARGNLHAAPDEVVALRNAVFVAHVVEGALLGAVVGDEQKLVVVVLLDPVVAEMLCLGGEVALLLVRNGVAVFLLEGVIEVGELHARERRGRNDDLRVKFFRGEGLLNLVAVLFLHLAKGVCEELLLKLHDILEGVDVAELDIEAGELGGMLAGEGLLGAEYGADLEVALKAACHGHLLVELRALRKVRIRQVVAREVIQTEHIRAGLGGCADELRRVNLDEIAVQGEVAKRAHESGLCLEHELVGIRAEVNPAVVDALVDGGTLHGSLLLRGRNVIARNRKRRCNGIDCNRGRDDLDAV